MLQYKFIISVCIGVGWYWLKGSLPSYFEANINFFTIETNLKLYGLRYVKLVSSILESILEYI